jgi:hypothetical protein
MSFFISAKPSPLPLTESERNRLENLSRLMDTRFNLPGTHLRFGLDSLIGLIPGLGDGTSLVLSLYPLKIAHSHRYPLWFKLRMAIRILIDFLIGLVPLIGDAFDVWYKCTKRNVNDLLEHDRKLQNKGMRNRE